MLFFEFGPFVLAIFSFIAAILLYGKDRQARENNEPEDPITPPDPSRIDDDARGPLRPSMRA